MTLIQNDHEHVKFKPKKNNLNPLESKNKVQQKRQLDGK